MEGNQNNPEKTEKKEKTKEKPRKRSESPVASKEELMAKRIELIVYVGNLPTSWKEDDIWKFFEEFGKILDVKLIKKNVTPQQQKHDRYLLH
jgi:RNA recognition motif-containing protein